MIGATRTIDQVSVFRERAEARATLVANGLMALQAAVDGMQEIAASSGLIEELGQDGVQAILAAAFKMRGA